MRNNPSFIPLNEIGERINEICPQERINEVIRTILEKRIAQDKRKAQASLKLTAREVRFLSGGNSGDAQSNDGRMSDYTDNPSPSKEDIPF